MNAGVSVDRRCALPGAAAADTPRKLRLPHSLAPGGQARTTSARPRRHLLTARAAWWIRDALRGERDFARRGQRDGPVMSDNGR